jgi:plasmid stabilization system protein ParE
MILRWTARALADLESIHAYQELHWPAMLASFEARLTAIERRIIEFPASAPEVEERPDVRVVAFRDFPQSAFFYRAEAHVIDVLATRHTSRQSPFE